MYKPNSKLNSSNIHIPSASSFYSLYDILSAFNLAFYLWHLIWHSIWHSLWHFFWHPDLTFLSDILSAFFLGAKSPAKPKAISRRKKSGEAHSDFRAVKARRGPQKLSRCKSPARPTAIRNWQVQSSEAADEVRRVSLQSRAGKWCPARRRKKEGRKEDVMISKNQTAPVASVESKGSIPISFFTISIPSTTVLVE